MPATPVVKIMALTEREFLSGCARLGAGDSSEPSTVRLHLGAGWAAIQYRALDSVRLGGLLQLPRAEVTLTFDGVAEAERTEFLRRFDIAFQRGGG